MDLVNKFSVGLLFSFPALLVSVHNGGSLILLLLFIIGLAGIFVKRGEVFTPFSRYEKHFIKAILFFVSIYVFHVLYFNSELSTLDNSVQILLFIPIFLYIRSLSLKPEVFYFSVLLAALACGLIALYQYFYLNLPRSYGVTNPVAFGSISMTFAMMCLTIALLVKQKPLSLLFYIGTLLAILASILSGSRGAWLILLSSILMLTIFNPIKWSLKSQLLGIIIVVVFIMMSYFYPPIQKRVDLANNQINAYFEKGDANSSVGIRLELWKTALMVSSDNLILGIGEGGFKKKMKELVEENKVDSNVLWTGHVHQEYLSALLNRGILGLASLLFIFVLPFIYFVKKATPSFKEQNILPILGLIITSSAMTISLTDVYFLQHQNILFYFSFIFIIFALMKQSKYKTSNPHNIQ